MNDRDFITDEDDEAVAYLSPAERERERRQGIVTTVLMGDTNPTLEPYAAKLKASLAADVMAALEADEAATRARMAQDPWAQALAEQAWADAVRAMGELTHHVGLLEKHTPAGVTHVLGNLRGDSAVVLASVMADLRARIAQVEAYVVLQVARDEMASKEGTLPDGRVYQVKKGATRKEWNHDDWKRDARQQIVSGIGVHVVDADTGAEIDLDALLRGVQEVHGSTAPRVTQLKNLGLDPGDYCQTVSGSWSLKVSAPGAADQDDV